MRRGMPFAMVAALAMIGVGSTPEPQLPVDIGDTRSRAQREDVGRVLWSRAGRSMGPAELARYSRKRQRQRQTHRGKRGKR